MKQLNLARPLTAVAGSLQWRALQQPLCNVRF
jgi:hypothetical protein